MLDVLLISPNGFSYQLMLDKIFPRKYQYDYALCCLASNLQKSGFSTKIIDGFAEDLSINDVMKMILENKPKIIGITTCAATIKEAKKIIEKIERLKIENSEFKNLEIILGGRHITTMPHFIKEFGVKYGLRGDAEESLPMLCKSILNNSCKDDIPGLVEYSGDNLRCKEVEVVNNLNSLPIQSLDFFIRKKEKRFKHPYLFVESSRGCPNMCYFCATPFYRRKVLYKSPEKVVEEIEELLSKYKTNFFIFIDGTFSTNKEHTLKICNLLRKRNLKIEWACSDRIDTVDEELLKEMKSAGCYAIFFGIESGVKRIRELCKKPFIEERCIEIFKFCNKIGITPSGNFIIGHPGETLEDVKETIRLSMKLEDSEVFFKPLMVLPDSLIYQQLLNEKKIEENFYHTCKKEPLILTPSSHLSEEEIKRQVIRGYVKFYFRIKPTIKIFSTRDIPTIYQAFKFRLIIAIEFLKREFISLFRKYFKICTKK